jgi:peptidoglycan/LPS O-acetylase OafA/YrhL
VNGDLGDFLAEGGAIVGGGAALGATLGFIAGSLVHDVRPQTDPDFWARRGAFFGGGAGLVALILRRRLRPMRMKTRERVVLLITVLAAVTYTLRAREWSDAAFYGGGAALIAVIVLAGLSWIEFAPDGAFRRRPQS